MYLNVTESYLDDCKVTRMQYHSFLPYSIKLINIQNMDAYILPCESNIYIKGKINPSSHMGQGIGNFSFTNNGLIFL